MQHTARSAEFMEKEGRAKAISTCKLLELDGIVAWAMTSDILLDTPNFLLCSRRLKSKFGCRFIH